MDFVSYNNNNYNNNSSSIHLMLYRLWTGSRCLHHHHHHIYNVFFFDFIFFEIHIYFIHSLCVCVCRLVFFHNDKLLCSIFSWWSLIGYHHHFYQYHQCLNTHMVISKNIQNSNLLIIDYNCRIYNKTITRRKKIEKLFFDHGLLIKR